MFHSRRAREMHCVTIMKTNLFFFSCDPQEVTAPAPNGVSGEGNLATMQNRIEFAVTSR